MDDVKLSKRLSLALRHDPTRFGLTLDDAGWTDIAAVLSALHMDRPTLDRVVAENSKKRFAFDESGTRIRANQGHSIAVDLGLPQAEPPAVLYHGTVAAALSPILADGLRPMSRHDVHLSATRDTAVTVGSRRGKPVVLTIDAARMSADGHVFQVSANGVWLTAHVPARYIST